MKQNNYQIADKKIILVVLLILAFVIWYKETAKETSTKKDIPKYNIHEHIESFKQIGALLKAMDRAGIQTTVLLGSPKETIFSGTG